MVFQLEEVELCVSDSVQPLGKASFGPAWNALEEGDTVEETFSLANVSSIHEAIKKVRGRRKRRNEWYCIRCADSLDWPLVRDRISSLREGIDTLS